MRLTGLLSAAAFTASLTAQPAPRVAEIRAIAEQGYLHAFAESGKNSLMDLFRGPAADGIAAMQEDFQ